MWLKPWRIIKPLLTNSDTHLHTHTLNAELKWTICMHNAHTFHFKIQRIFFSRFDMKTTKINRWNQILPLIAFSHELNYRIICILLERWMGCYFLVFHLDFGISFHFISLPTANVMKYVEIFHVQFNFNSTGNNSPM